METCKYTEVSYSIETYKYTRVSPSIVQCTKQDVRVLKAPGRGILAESRALVVGRRTCAMARNDVVRDGAGGKGATARRKGRDGAGERERRNGVGATALIKHAARLTSRDTLATTPLLLSSVANVGHGSDVEKHRKGMLTSPSMRVLVEIHSLSDA